MDEIERASPNARRREIPGQRYFATGFAPEMFAEILTWFFAGLARDGRPHA